MNVLKRIREYVFPRMDARCRIRVFMCLISSAYASTFATTILPEMILELGYNEEDKGYYSGLTLSVFNLGLGIGGFVWGYMWDRNVGQRTLMVTGLLANATLCLSFGFCTNLFTLLIVRFMTGITNGVIVAIKACLYENCDNSDHAASMSFYSFSYSLGQVIGMTLSGFLSSRGIISTDKCTFLRNYPYFLAGFVGFCISLITVVIEITLYSKQERSNEYIAISSNSNGSNDSCNENQMNCGRSEELDDSLHDTNNINYSEKSQNDTSQLYSGTIPLFTNTIRKYIAIGLFLKSIVSYDVLLTFAVTTLFTFSNSGFKSIFVVWLSTSHSIGGLGLATHEVGLIFGLTNIVSVIILILLPLCERKYGAIRSYSMCIVVLFIMVNVLPICQLLKLPHRIWTVVCLTIAMKFCVSMSRGLNSIITNNSAPIESVGTVNGLSEFIGAVGKTVGPFAMGSLFYWTVSANIGSYFDSSFAFVVIGVVFWFLAVLIYCLPRHLNYKRTIA